MGLIKTGFKLLKYGIVFSLGYYFGSVKSDNYNCIFNENKTKVEFFDNKGYDFSFDDVFLYNNLKGSEVSFDVFSSNDSLDSFFENDDENIFEKL